jgi:3-deoxy-D-manno-octulosonate 8-phosphate phosphatase (KDO 8-P phosphatase)
MDFFRKNISYLYETGKIEEDLFQQFSENQHPELNSILLISDIAGITTDNLLKQDLRAQAAVPSDLRLIIFDIDGVMTDGGMFYTESGDELKKFNAKDGLAIRMLNHAGFETGIISHGTNINLIQKRADIVHIKHVYCGVEPKSEVLMRWCDALEITPQQVAFIGDDINDLSIINIVGFSACPADALPAVKNAVNVVLSRKGGDACVREWIDNYLLKSGI